MHAIRQVAPGDLAFLQEMLYEAIFTPPGAPRPSRAILDVPEIAGYLAGWGRPGDRGFIAEVDGKPAGAAWFRCFPAEAPGYGFVRPDIPELTIAVGLQFRGCGLGTILLERLVGCARADRYPGISLSVSPSNPAARLYARLGFREVGMAGDSALMLLTWAGVPNG